jgi:hypothetical protein
MVRTAVSSLASQVENTGEEEFFCFVLVGEGLGLDKLRVFWCFQWYWGLNSGPYTC